MNKEYTSNRTNILTKEASCVKKAILDYKCLLIEQLKYFIKYPERCEKICKHLKMEQCINHDEIYAYSYDVDTEPNQNMIDSMWVAIDMLSPIEENAEDTSIAEFLQNQVLPLEIPESVCVITNDTVVNHIMSVQNIEEIARISLVNEKLHLHYSAKEGEEDKIACTLIIAIRDEKLLNYISALQLKLPHKIALLSGGMIERPDIAYYGN